MRDGCAVPYAKRHPIYPICAAESRAADRQPMAADRLTVHFVRYDACCSGEEPIFLMARETITRLVDDLDGSAASRTVRFSWQGVSYEIDMSDEHTREFDRAVEPYVQAARRVTGAARKSAGRRGQASRELNLAAVRSWAAQNGHRVAERGRIPRQVLDAFQAAHRGGANNATAANTSVAAAAAPRKAAARKAPAKKAARKARGRAAGKAPAKRRAVAS
jgi:hypothetical protein